MCSTGGTATTAGIRQEFFVNRITKPVKNWNRNALKGLTYLITDKGPMKGWLHKIGRAEGDKCVCSIHQNAAHILQCKEVGDGKGRSLEEAEADEGWCEAVYEMLIKNIAD